ncbi:MAG TPA: extracellular solute-binding protein [Gaiellales bacterium]|nr:extracellular solute-binding protein [Gaiellales bacterium]
MSHQTRPPAARVRTRREFLAEGSVSLAALAGAGGLLSACSNSTSAGPSSAGSGAGGQPTGPGGLPLPRPDHPVTLPRWEDPIESGLQPETGGEFIVFNYADYIYPKILKDFGKKYGVTVRVEPFDNITSAMTILASGSIHPDVMNLTIDHLEQAVAAKLIKPINLDYVPNLKRNVWPSLVSPYYDVGSRYTVPYTVTATGIYWRTDKVSEDIASMSNPWDMFWQSSAYSGEVTVLDEVRETIAMALLHAGDLDINTEDPAKIDSAVADLQKLYSICNVRTLDTQWQKIPEGKAFLSLAWSGDPLASVFYDLKTPSEANLLRFWWPGKGKGPTANDTFAVCSTTNKPVLGHLFLNYLVDNGVAYSNFVDFNGYQPPLNEIDPHALVQKGLIPETLQNTVLTETDIGPTSIQECPLTVAGQALWQDGFSKFQSGA